MPKPPNGNGVLVETGFKKQLTQEQKNPNGVYSGMTRRCALDGEGFAPSASPASTKKTSKNRE